MAMTLQQQQSNDSAPLSPTSERPATATNGSPSAPGSPSPDANTEAPKSPIQSTTSAVTAAANAAKRKPSRRANTAERRATHNAVERQRRETLNGRFLDLAALLPNLSQIRRPSKSSIVNSSIAYIHASRRHRMLASRELRLLKAEGDALRRELNEWRDRAGLPRVEEPLRSEGFAIVVNGEMDAMMISAEMGAHHGMTGHMGGIDEDLEDGDDDWGMGPGSASGPSSAYPKDDGDLIASAPYGAQPPLPHQQPQQAGFGTYGGMQGPQSGFHQGFMEDDRHGKIFAHNIPHRSPMVGYESTQGAGALFTPPVSRDGPITLMNPATGGSNNGGSVSGGASPISVHSVASASPEMHASHGRSMSGSPTGFNLNAQQPQQRRGSSGSGGASPAYELGYASGPGSGYGNGGSGSGHNGAMGGMMHGYHMGGMGMSMGMGGGMGAYGGHGHGPAHGGHGQMVGVGAGAMGGVFQMML